MWPCARMLLFAAVHPNSMVIDMVDGLIMPIYMMDETFGA